MKISKRETRFLVVGALAVFAYVGIVYVIEPLVASQLEVREQVWETRAVLERHRSLPPERDRYQRKVDALKARLHQAEELLMKGEKAPLAAAEVQGVIHRFGQESSLNIVRENVPPPKQTETFVEVPVELSMRGNLQAVRDFLYRVQMAENLLTVPKLVIRSRRSRDGTLSVDLRVAGHMRHEEKR